MNRFLFKLATYIQLSVAIVMSIGCTPVQPYFMNEKPQLEHYLNSVASVEYPDVEVDKLPETTESLAPLTVDNHEYVFWDMSLEECVEMALTNARFLPTTSGTAEFRQGIASQFVSGTAAQFGSVYDVALQETTTQGIALAIDGNGNRLLPRGVVRANQVGGVEDALAEFDAVFSGFVDVSNVDRPQNTAAFDPDPNDGNDPQFLQSFDTSQQTAMSKRLATGGVASMRQILQYGRNDSGNIVNQISNSDYTAAIEAQVQHPLSRNRGTYINRIPVLLASTNEDITIANYEAQVRNLVRDVENAYWDLYLAYRAVSTATTARDFAQLTAEISEFKEQFGEDSLQAVSQARAQYFNFQRRLVGALNGSNLPGEDRFGVYGRERALRELLGITITDGRLIRPTHEPTQARVDFDWEQSVAQMLYLSPELREKKYQIKQAQLELALAKNQILPDVNLSLLYRWVGVGSHFGSTSRSPRFPSPESSALTELTSGDFQEGEIRLEFNMPVGVRREKARIRNAQLTLRSREDFLRESERMAVSQLSDAVAKTKSHYSQLHMAANEWQASELEANTRLYQFQNRPERIDPNTVLQSQQRLAEAQINYYRALTEYNKSLNYVDYLRGTLLAQSGITLREGPWNSKAYCDALERARERAAGKQWQYGVTRPGVIRRGPVKNAEGAVLMYGDEINTQGVPANLGESLLTPQGMAIPEVNDESLQTLPTPKELISPELNQPAMPTPADQSGINPTAVNPTGSEPAANAGVAQATWNDNRSQEVHVANLESSAVGSGLRQAQPAATKGLGIEPVRRKPVTGQSVNSIPPDHP